MLLHHAMRLVAVILAWTALSACRTQQSAPSLWVSNPPGVMSHSPAQRPVEARFSLLDGTVVGLLAPRRVGDRMVGTVVSSCMGPGCVEALRGNAVDIAAVQSMEARYRATAGERRTARAAAEERPAARATAGEPPAARATAESAPHAHRDVGALPWRVEPGLWFGGFVPTASNRYTGGMAGGVDIFVRSRIGLGVALGFSGGGRVVTGSEAASPSVSWYGGDLSAALALQLVGDGRTGLRFIPRAGISMSYLGWNPGRGPQCPAFSITILGPGCTPPPYTPAPAAFESGWYWGAVLGATFSANFPYGHVGLKLDWRPNLTGDTPVHLLTIAVVVGGALP